MSFDPGAGLDPGQVRDVRGRTGRGTLALGGGGLGLLVTHRGHPARRRPQRAPGRRRERRPVTGPGSSVLMEECQTGQDANERADCRIVGYVNSVQEYWDERLRRCRAASTGRPRRSCSPSSSRPRCGGATSAGRAVLLPARRLVYLDLGFFDAAPGAVRRQWRPLRRGLRRRPRVRPPRPVPPRAPGPRRGSGGRGRRRRPDGADGRLPGGRLGRQRGGHAGHRRRRPARTSRTRSTPRRRSATTGSRPACRARSTRSRGRTARRSSASAGSPPGSRRATWRPATRSRSTNPDIGPAGRASQTPDDLPSPTRSVPPAPARSRPPMPRSPASPASRRPAGTCGPPSARRDPSR